MNKTDKPARLKAWFESAVSAEGYLRWRAEAKLAWDFYDGNHWSAEEVTALQAVGQPAIVINKIAAKVDNLLGAEVRGRTRVIYRSRSGQPDEEKTARALSDLALYVAEQGEQGAALSQVFKDGMVGGIGWLDISVATGASGPEIVARAEDPFSVVWDPLSRRHDLSDARFVARERWLSSDELTELFGERSAAIQKQQKSWPGGLALKDDSVRWSSRDGETLRVVEMQYREACTQWRLRGADGRLFCTWQKPTRTMGRIESVESTPRVRVAYLAGETLLDDRWLAEGFSDFTLLPFVCRRQKSDGRPYGMVRAAMDPQRELNKRRSKAMHLLNTAQVIADIDAVDDPNMLAREAARPDGIILKRAGKDLRIIRNTDLAASQVGVMEQAARDIQEVIGIYDETLGKESNATSGTAILQRQQAGSLNQMALFDALRVLKKTLGRQVLGLIRQYFTHEMVIRIVDELGASRVVLLNKKERDSEGRETVLHDVSAGDYDVVVEEVRDVLSARDREVGELEQLRLAGVPVPAAVLVQVSALSEAHKQLILAALDAGKKE